MFDDLLQVRCPGVCFYVLRDAAGLYLIDGGFIGGMSFLTRALRRRGWSGIPIRGILVTHGHLDHIRNISRLATTPDCWIAAPSLDRLHYEGKYLYTGASRVCGILEWVGRTLFGYAPFRIDRALTDGDEIAVWGGLQAVHLPGHTDGHMGFYSRDRRFLFCGDLFASYRWLSYTPSNIFNSHLEMIPSSIDKALKLRLDGVAPNHCDRASYQEHLLRLQNLRKQICRRADEG